MSTPNNPSADAKTLANLAKETFISAGGAIGDKIEAVSEAVAQAATQPLREAIKKALLLIPDSGAYVTIEDIRNADEAKFTLNQALEETK